WAFYGHRRNLYRAAVPHAGFARLLEIGTAKPAGYFVFTSNVDGQFQKVGFSTNRIVECHGSIFHLQCAAPCSAEIWDAPPDTVKLDESVFRALDPLPKCRHCAAVARPNILMFGDWHWLSQRTEAQEVGFSRWLGELTARHARLVVVELGAGSAIPTVRYMSERVARQHGGTLIRINPREPEVPQGQIGLPVGAAEGVHWISEQIGC